MQLTWETKPVLGQNGYRNYLSSNSDWRVQCNLSKPESKRWEAFRVDHPHGDFTTLTVAKAYCQTTQEEIDGKHRWRLGKTLAVEHEETYDKSSKELVSGVSTPSPTPRYTYANRPHASHRQLERLNKR